jgi:hypothetical protein
LKTERIYNSESLNDDCKCHNFSILYFPFLCQETWHLLSPPKNSKNSHVRTLIRLDHELLACRLKGKLTPMMEACFKGNLDLVRLFLSYNCDPNEKYGDDQYTPLMLAALGGHAEIMVSLLEAGADPHAKNRIGKTAAMLCGFVGMKESHRILNCWIMDSSFIDELVLRENWTK